MLRGFLKVRFFRFKDIWNKFLRIAVVEREPSALDLHHDAVTFFENVIRRVQVNRKQRDFARFEGLPGFLKQIVIAATDNLVGNHQLVAREFPVLGSVFLRVHIYKFDDPIAVAAGCGGEELGSDLGPRA